MDSRENWLRAVEFHHPQWIPCEISLFPLVWKTHREELEELVLAHPRLFPGFQKGVIHFDQMPVGFRAGERFTDKWGCVRLTTEDGIGGQTIYHPLADWSALTGYQAPDPTQGTLDPITQGLNAYLSGKDAPLTWDKVEASVNEKKRQGELVKGDGEKLFDRLYFLRGFENLMLDFATDPPELMTLIGMLQQYELKLIDKWLQMGVDYISFHTDFATQQGLMISPKSFRKYLKPLFTALFQPCRRAGVHVLLSSDGRMLDVVDDMVECGVSIHDPQLRPNTAEGIARAYRGKLCAKVDLDQQGFPFMTPAEIRAMIKETVDTLAVPEGGLMLTANVYDADVPLRNIEAIAVALEDYCLG
jgi:uroporphyrinogen decarboxylase